MFSTASLFEVCIHKGSQGTAGEAGLHKKVQNRKADCCTLHRRITNSKVLIRKSVQSTFTPNRVASLGPMAPCRSHHRNHTRLEWIIVVIRQELNPVTCRLDGKQINQRRILRIMEVLLSDHHVLIVIKKNRIGGDRVNMKIMMMLGYLA